MYVPLSAAEHHHHYGKSISEQCASSMQHLLIGQTHDISNWIG